MSSGDEDPVQEGERENNSLFVSSGARPHCSDV